MHMGAHLAPPFTPITGARLLFVFNVHVLSVNHAFVLLLARAIAARSRALSIRRTSTASPRSSARRSLRSLVHLLRQLVRRRRQLLARRIHRRLVAAFDGLLPVRNRVLDISTLAARDLVAMLLQHFLHAIYQRVELILGVDLLAPNLVFRRVSIGFFRPSLNPLLRQP